MRLNSEHAEQDGRVSVRVFIIQGPGPCHVQARAKDLRGSKIRTRIQEMPGHTAPAPLATGPGYAAHVRGASPWYVRYSHCILV